MLDALLEHVHGGAVYVCSVTDNNYLWTTCGGLCSCNCSLVSIVDHINVPVGKTYLNIYGCGQHVY